MLYAYVKTCYHRPVSLQETQNLSYQITSQEGRKLKDTTMAIIIDGKKISTKIKDELREEVKVLHEKAIHPCLAVIQVGSDPASTVYVGNKKKACAYIGIESRSYELPEETSQEELLSLIRQLNEDDAVHGILVQLPVPSHMDEKEIINTISPEKDVDGFHPQNVGALSIGDEGFVSCTPAGIIEMLKQYDLEIDGKDCVVVGRSNIVGKPISMLLLRENGTVTVCHSHTKNLKEICNRADILVSAIGKPRFFDASYIKEGAVVVDVGIHRDQDNSLCGDVDFESVSAKAGAITPVPGGVGPMTITMLMRNCIESAKRKSRT
jgi:methylenetetrahydrofolate dehydrogenase (NADP+)/methenyltetrahydrofolate cyclohydrolase